jgi:hypothetical protein
MRRTVRVSVRVAFLATFSIPISRMFPGGGFFSCCCFGGLFPGAAAAAAGGRATTGGRAAAGGASKFVMGISTGSAGSKVGLCSTRQVLKCFPHDS